MLSSTGGEQRQQRQQQRAQRTKKDEDDQDAAAPPEFFDDDSSRRGGGLSSSSSLLHHSNSNHSSNSRRGSVTHPPFLARQTSSSSASLQQPSVIHNNNNRNNNKNAAAAQRRRNNSPGVLINTGLSLTVFLVLIQFFDPTLHQHHKDEMLHHHVQHNPIRMALADFVSGQEAMRQRRRRDDDEHRILTRENVALGRERILQLLQEAGVLPELTLAEMDRLPLWKTVEKLYGDKVIIVGKEECEHFRQRVPKEDRILGVAGLFNTGTNLLDTQMRKNIHMPQASLWQVPWGKHRMAEVKWNHTATNMEKHNKNHVLPVVMLRDPFAWLQSMCSHPYATAWRHGKHHCPNLVPSQQDREHFQSVPEYSFNVTIVFDKKMINHYQSLIHLWSEWYRQYLEADYPVLLIRFEDLVFQPVTVLREIADCVEGTLAHPIQYQVQSSKSHGSGTDYIKALIKTADTELRLRNLTTEDLDFAHTHLDAELLQIFRYNFPDS